MVKNNQKKVIAKRIKTTFPKTYGNITDGVTTKGVRVRAKSGQVRILSIEARNLDILH